MKIISEKIRDARQLAFKVLNRVERDQAWAEAVLNHEIERASLCSRERALGVRLVYGCLAWRAYLDWHIAALSTTAPDKLETEVRQLLRLGLYQILKLDRVPAYAAVSSTVNLAKLFTPRAAGLVNAVLRRALRDRNKVTLPSASKSLSRHLAIRYSHPQWMVQMWLDEPNSVGAKDAGEVEAFLAANNQLAHTVLRIPRSRQAQLLELLAGEGISTRPGCYSPEAVVIEGRVDLPSVVSLAGPEAVVQGEASQLIAHLAASHLEGEILDACAGPGGKATYMAQLAGNRSTVFALDIQLRAAKRVVRLAQRLKLTNVHTLVGDARQAGELFASASFAGVLVDAPCSGLGTLRSHPELRWVRNDKDPAELARLQLDIMRAVAPLVRPGGLIVYSTCTLTRVENEELVATFQGEQPEFVLEDPRAHLPAQAHGLVGDQAELRTLPHHHGLDGFFAVCLRRQA